MFEDTGYPCIDSKSVSDFYGLPRQPGVEMYGLLISVDTLLNQNIALIKCLSRFDGLRESHNTPRAKMILYFIMRIKCTEVPYPHSTVKR